MVELSLDKLLEKREKTLYWLWKETNIPHTILHRYRHNKSEGIKLAHIDAICTALECTPGELISYKASQSKKKRKISPAS